jgi:hypothetical protein
MSAIPRAKSWLAHLLLGSQNLVALSGDEVDNSQYDNDQTDKINNTTHLISPLCEFLSI